MADDVQIIDVVDEFADYVDPARIEAEADRLGITPEDLIKRIAAELTARVES